MFLIRTAFWLILIILLLPTNEEQQRQVYGTASTAVNDIKTFCLRNPDVCETGKSAFDSFSEKAQFGAKLLFEFVRDAGNEAVATAPMEQDRGQLSMSRRELGQSTLTDDDMKPLWTAPRG